MIEEPIFSTNPPPGKAQAIAIITLISGIMNIIYGLTLTLLVVIGTIGIGLLCSPLTFAPAVLGIFEIIAGAKLMSKPARKFNVKTIAILEIVAVITLAMPSLVAGILNLVFYNDPEVKNYIDSLPA